MGKFWVVAGRPTAKNLYARNEREKVLRAQRFWAVGRPATTQNFPIYLTRAHSELCRKTFADALVCKGIPVMLQTNVRQWDSD